MAKAEEQIDWERQREQVRFASPMDFSETQESLASASLLLHSSPSHPEKRFGLQGSSHPSQKLKVDGS